METPCFNNTESFYRYKLNLTPGLSLTKSALISAGHKLNRRDKPSQWKALVHSFFCAVARVVPAPTAATPSPIVPSTLGAAITNFLNRFATTIFEEGGFLHLTDDAQAELVENLVAAQQCRRRCKWGKLINRLYACIDLTTGVYRGRLISLARYQILFEPAAKNSAVPHDVFSLFQKLEPTFCDASLNASQKKALRNVVGQRLKVAVPLLDDCEHYDNCKELARVLWMTAAIMPLMAEDVRSAGPGENGPADPVFPTMEELTEVGVFDLHVRGKNKASAQEEFLTAGSRVANPTPFKLFGREYAEFDDAYVASKRARFEVERREAAAAAAAKPSKKRKARETPVDADAAAEKQAKKAAKEARHTEFPLPPSAPAYAREAGPDALDLITPTSGLLGFKHATVLGTLKSDLAGFKQGTEVFLKLGEPEAGGAFSVACNDRMAALGMPHVRVATTTAVYDARRWHALATSDQFETPPQWLHFMFDHMKQHDNRAVSLQIADVFDGMRLTNVPKEHPTWLEADGAGKSLFEAFYFAKYVGVKDLGPYNMMMNKDGEALLVDLNEAGKTQWPKYNKKGLQTAHRLKNAGPAGDHLARALKYAADHPDAAADFVDRLVKTPAHPQLQSDLFSNEARAALRAGGARRGEAFYAACMKGVTPPRRA